MPRAAGPWRHLLLRQVRLVAPESIAPEQGAAFLARLPDDVPAGDDLGDDGRSPLRLFEDGRELGPAHAPHDEIRALGGGRFSHWQHSLYFSSSDGSSPLGNSRRYRIVLDAGLVRRGRAGLAWIGAGAGGLARTALAPARLGARRNARVEREGILYAFYDLEEAPVTYDVAAELVIAELERRRRGLASLHLVLVPGAWRLRHQDGFSEAVDEAAVALRLAQLALPLAALLPSCTGVTLCASRAQAEELLRTVAREVHPTGYDPRRPREHRVDMARARAPGVSSEAFFPMLRANAEARRAAAHFLAARVGARRAIVITLRQSRFVPARNSRLDDWVAFADGLDPERYVAVFIPDTARAFEPHPGLDRHVRCEAASWSVPLRMALYEAASLNLAHMGGPLELVLYNEDCRYAVFIPLNTSPQTRESLLVERGFVIGRNLPFARPGQQIVWELDALPAIRRVFDELESSLAVPSWAAS